jgi:thiol-disulfide isomerase/thioredoxin
MRSNRLRALIFAAALAGFALLAATSAKPDDFSPDRFGIGATLVQPEDSTYIEVRECAPNGPAARAGLEAGDRILELDGQSIRDWPFRKVRDYLIRSEPLPLRITAQRGKDVVHVELVRMRIAEILAEQGLRAVPDTTAGYRLVPLHARPEVKVGDVVPLDSLMNPACRPGTLYPVKTSTILYFWTSWCAPCKTLFKRLEDGSDHRKVAINLDRTCEEFKKALSANDPPGEEFWAFGWYGPLSQSLGIYRRGVPTAALLDADGRLICIATGVDPIMLMIRTEPPAALKPVFLRAANEFQVPADVLMAVAYEMSKYQHRDGEPDAIGSCGVMGLQVVGVKPTTLDTASKLIGLPPDSLRSLEANVRGGAALLAHEFIAVHGKEDVASKMRVVENWRPVLPRYTRYTESLNQHFFAQFKECLAARGFGGS